MLEHYIRGLKAAGNVRQDGCIGIDELNSEEMV